jgi:hypothetical protein
MVDFFYSYFDTNISFFIFFIYELCMCEKNSVNIPKFIYENPFFS